jgi:hypothetical protein
VQSRSVLSIIFRLAFPCFCYQTALSHSLKSLPFIYCTLPGHGTKNAAHSLPFFCYQTPTHSLTNALTSFLVLSFTLPGHGAENAAAAADMSGASRFLMPVGGATIAMFMLRVLLLLVVLM